MGDAIIAFSFWLTGEDICTFSVWLMGEDIIAFSFWLMVEDNGTLSVYIRRSYTTGSLTYPFSFCFQLLVQKLQEKQWRLICTCSNADVKAAISFLVAKIQRL